MKVEILSEDLVKKIKEKSNFVLLDVREQEEWNLGFISGALHLPLTRLGKEAEKSQTHRTRVPRRRAITG